MFQLYTQKESIKTERQTMIPECNWFEANSGPEYFSKHLAQFKDKPVDFLQIGVFTGNASIWMLENVLTHPDATLTDVDTWLGSVEHGGMDFRAIEKLYDSRVDGRTIKLKTDSDSFFQSNDRMFDFIYIDGDHSYEQVKKDGENALAVLKPDGIIAFDDHFDAGIAKAVSEVLVPGLSQIEEQTHQQAWFRLTR